MDHSTDNPGMVVQRQDGQPASSERLSLQNVPLFEDFDQSELFEVEQLVEAVHFDRRDTIVREGELGATLYLILAGSVAVTSEGTEANKGTIIAILQPGDYFGEMCLFDKNATRSASVRAVTPVKLGAINRSDFDALLNAQPRLLTRVLQTLTSRIREANETIRTQVHQEVAPRVATLLLGLMKKCGESTSTGTRITLRLTNGEMARMTASTRETINRTLNRFWDDQLIDMSSEYVVVTDERRLHLLADAAHAVPAARKGENRKVAVFRTRALLPA